MSMAGTTSGPSAGLTGDSIRAGFIPLLDAAPLIVAAHEGFAEAEGLRLTLARETSWATLRDRLAVGHLDVAHMLAPMVIASNLGLGPLPLPLLAPMALGFGGNTITVSRAIWSDLQAFAPPLDFDAMRAAKAVAALVAQRRRQGRPPLTLAIVHAYSMHHYVLAYWLAAGGLDPRRDVEMVVVPPPLMAAALEAGQIDGFCVGEPWGSVASESGAGCILTTSAHVWQTSPDKVLGVRSAWAQADGERLSRLVRAVYRAALWCDDPANRDRLASLLARPDLLGQPEAVLLPGLERRLVAGGGAATTVEGLLTFAAGASTFPWTSRALWMFAQMARWGQVDDSAARRDIARASFRPDLYRAALTPLGLALPGVDTRIEGALPGPWQAAGMDRGGMSGRFMDGLVFNADASDAVAPD